MGVAQTVGRFSGWRKSNAILHTPMTITELGEYVGTRFPPSTARTLGICRDDEGIWVSLFWMI